MSRPFDGASGCDGDDTRVFYLQLEEGRTDQSSYFARVNAGKESVAVDLSSPDGLKVVLDLAGHADVFIENFAPGVVGRLGCDYKAVSAVKPDIVYCSISGFGQTGPWRHKQAFAHITNAISGLMHLEQGDEAHPRASNLQAADMLAATHAATAILGALLRRTRTGQGAHLDVSMLDLLRHERSDATVARYVFKALRPVFEGVNGAITRSASEAAPTRVQCTPSAES